MKDRRVIQTEHAPKAIGPYSQGIVSEGLLFCSGQIPLDPVSGKIVDGSIEEQAHRMFQNLRAVVQAAGSDLNRTLKTTLFLKNMDHFCTVNAIYGEYFAAPYPARSTIQVARLPLDAAMEIEAIVRT